MKMFARLVPACLFLCVPLSQASAGVLTNHKGRWMGELKLPDGTILNTGLEIFRRADGSTWASLAMIDQAVFDIPVTSLTQTGSAANVKLSFGEFDLVWVRDHFDGRWNQGGRSFPVELRNVAEFPRKSRIQAPVGPFPYHSRELAIRSSDGVTLGATLSVPKGVAKPNLVVLVSGSGPMTRDEDVAGHRLFAVMADYLARQGIAVLRYDKRGVARSTGDYANHTEKQLQDDLAAVLSSMKARREFGSVGVIGHSEGPMVAAAVARRQPRLVDFLVSMAGVGMPGLDVMLLQDRLAASDRGASPAEVDRLEVLGRQFYEIVIAQPDSEARLAALTAYRSGLSPADKALIEKYDMQTGSLSIEQARRPALRAVLLSDPRDDWRHVKCPVLAINGSLDHQVPPQSLMGIRQALIEGGNPNVETEVLPSLNHLFQTARTGSEEEYATIAETMALGALKRIASFVRQR